MAHTPDACPVCRGEIAEHGPEYMPALVESVRGIAVEIRDQLAKPAAQPRNNPPTLVRVDPARVSTWDTTLTPTPPAYQTGQRLRVKRLISSGGSAKRLGLYVNSSLVFEFYPGSGDPVSLDFELVVDRGQGVLVDDIDTPTTSLSSVNWRTFLQADTE